MYVYMHIIKYNAPLLSTIIDLILATSFDHAVSVCISVEVILCSNETNEGNT